MIICSGWFANSSQFLGFQGHLCCTCWRPKPVLFKYLKGGVSIRLWSIFKGSYGLNWHLKSRNNIISIPIHRPYLTGNLLHKQIWKQISNWSDVAASASLCLGFRLPPTFPPLSALLTRSGNEGNEKKRPLPSWLPQEEDRMSTFGEVCAKSLLT